ncbi:MAG: hypothetical protein HYS98_00475 [Deltaproteobacteria bacterium]|nr:hypothetical protein [Deltaproteobacteria bacterium]
MKKHIIFTAFLSIAVLCQREISASPESTTNAKRLVQLQQNYSDEIQKLAQKHGVNPTEAFKKPLSMEIQPAFMKLYQLIQREQTTYQGDDVSADTAVEKINQFILDNGLEDYLSNHSRDVFKKMVAFETDRKNSQALQKIEVEIQKIFQTDQLQSAQESLKTMRAYTKDQSEQLQTTLKQIYRTKDNQWKSVLVKATGWTDFNKASGHFAPEITTDTFEISRRTLILANPYKFLIPNFVAQRLTSLFNIDDDMRNEAYLLARRFWMDTDYKDEKSLITIGLLEGSTPTHPRFNDIQTDVRNALTDKALGEKDKSVLTKGLMKFIDHFLYSGDPIDKVQYSLDTLVDNAQHINNSSLLLKLCSDLKDKGAPVPAALKDRLNQLINQRTE